MSSRRPHYAASDGDLAGRLVGRAVPEELADRRAEREADPLQERGRERQLHRVEVRVRDHREAQQVRHPLAVRLAVGREGEHRLEQRLELQRRPHLAHEVRDVVAGVPELVRRSRRHDEPLARARRPSSRGRS